MAFRTTAASPAVVSVATAADLSSVDTSFLVDGDLGFTSDTGEFWFYRPLSAAAIAPGILETSNSQGATLPGRWLLLSGVFGLGSSFVYNELVGPVPVPGTPPGPPVAFLFTPFAVTTKPNVKIDFDASGDAAAAPGGPCSIAFEVLLDGAPFAVPARTGCESAGVGIPANAGLTKIQMGLTAGPHSVVVIATTLMPNGFTINPPIFGHGAIAIELF